MTRRRARAPAFVLAAATCLGAVLPSCGYRLAGTGGGLPSHVEALAILEFENQSAYPEVEEALAEAIIDEFSSRGRFEVQESEEGAQAVLRGVILGVDVEPGRLDPATGAAANYLVVVRTAVELEDLTNGDLLFESDEFTLRDEFEIAEDPEQSLDLEGLAFVRIAETFADTLAVAIFEGF